MLQANIVEKIETHTFRPITFFPENRAVYEIIWKKYCAVGNVTNDK